MLNQLDNGSEVITLKLTTGDIIGVSESVLETVRFIATVKSCTGIYVAEMSNAKFKDWVGRYPSFINFVLKNMVTRLHYGNSLAANCKSGTSRANIIKYFIERYNFEQKSHFQEKIREIVIQETHEMLATFLGVSTRTLERQIAILKKEKLIHIQRGKILITEAQYQELLHQVTIYV